MVISNIDNFEMFPINIDYHHVINTRFKSQTDLHESRNTFVFDTMAISFSCDSGYVEFKLYRGKSKRRKKLKRFSGLLLLDIIDNGSEMYLIFECDYIFEVTAKSKINIHVEFVKEYILRHNMPLNNILVKNGYHINWSLVNLYGKMGTKVSRKRKHLVYLYQDSYYVIHEEYVVNDITKDRYYICDQLDEFICQLNKLDNAVS